MFKPFLMIALSCATLNAAAVLLVAGVMPTWVDAHQWSRVRLSQGVDLSDFR